MKEKKITLKIRKNMKEEKGKINFTYYSILNSIIIFSHYEDEYQNNHRKRNNNINANSEYHILNKFREKGKKFITFNIYLIKI